MSNYKTTIGGAFSVLGTTLIGVGVVPQLAGVPNPLLTKLAIAGFCCSALGKFLAALFAADARTVRDLTDQVNSNTTVVQNKPNP